MKYLLLIALAFFVFWYLKRSAGRGNGKGKGPVSPLPQAEQAMVRCARCGVHLPREEALGVDGDYFCSDQHRRLGKSPRT